VDDRFEQVHDFGGRFGRVASAAGVAQLEGYRELTD
jgi:hypothetical protein